MTPKEFIQKLIAERDSLYGNWRGDADKKQRYYLLKEMVRQLKNAVKHTLICSGNFICKSAVLCLRILSVTYYINILCSASP